MSGPEIGHGNSEARGSGPPLCLSRAGERDTFDKGLLARLARPSSGRGALSADSRRLCTPRARTAATRPSSPRGRSRRSAAGGDSAASPPWHAGSRSAPCCSCGPRPSRSSSGTPAPVRPAPGLMPAHRSYGRGAGEAADYRVGKSCAAQPARSPAHVLRAVEAARREGGGATGWRRNVPTAEAATWPASTWTGRSAVGTDSG